MPHSSLLVAALGVALASGAAAQSARADTVDVAVGSPLVDFSKHRPGTTRTIQQVTTDGRTTTVPPFLWKFAFVDTGPRPLLLAHSEPEQPNPNAPHQPTYVFDRKTLVLRALLDATQAPIVTSDGATIRGSVPGRGGPMPIDVTLPSPAFYGPLVDLVAESLPWKTGVVYRVPQWRPGATSAELHLYRAVRREDMTVLGKTFPRAWVVEDRDASGTTLLGTLWLTDGPPHLIRWIINGPNGTVIQLDQEVAPSARGSRTD